MALLFRNLLTTHGRRVRTKHSSEVQYETELQIELIRDKPDEFNSVLNRNKLLWTGKNARSTGNPSAQL